MLKVSQFQLTYPRKQLRSKTLLSLRHLVYSTSVVFSQTSLVTKSVTLVSENHKVVLRQRFMRQLRPWTHRQRLLVVKLRQIPFPPSRSQSLLSAASLLHLHKVLGLPQAIPSLEVK